MIDYKKPFDDFDWLLQSETSEGDGKQHTRFVFPVILGRLQRVLVREIFLYEQLFQLHQT